MNLEAPRTLPVNLSHSSIELYLQCSEKWRRRYIANEYEPPVGIQVLGRAVHQAEAGSYHTMVETGQPHEIAHVLDDFSTSLDNEAEKTEVDWQDDSKGTLKDRGTAMLAVYHRAIVPAMKPIAAEQEFHVKLHPEYEWDIKGYIDIIGSTDDGFIQSEVGPHDIKTVTKAKSQADVDSSIQATLYSYATMLEGQTSNTFRVHQLKVLKDGAHADIIETVRDREAHTLYLERVAKVAREIEWRMQSGDWQGAAPGSWWCRARSCGYFNTCPMATR